MRAMLTKSQLDHLEKCLDDYNEIFTVENPPPLLQELEFLISNDEMVYEETVLLGLLHFFMYYKGLDTSVEEFIDVMRAMGGLEVEQEDKENYED